VGILRYILIVVAGLSLILAACSIEPSATSPDASTADQTEMSKTNFPAFSPSSPIKVNLSISKLPVLNERVEVTCTVVSRSDAPNSTAQIKLSKGAILIDGYLEWQGDLKANVPVSFSAQIAFEETGHHKIEATASYIIDDKNGWGDLDAIYLDIGTESSNFGWPVTPVLVRARDKWSVIETDLEVSHAPKLNEPAKLFITILSPVDYRGLTAQIIFFEGVELLEGDWRQPIDLKAGVPLHLSATIVFTETGNHSVTADVAEFVCGAWHNSPQDTIYFNIGVEHSTYKRYEPPQPPAVTTITSKWQNPLPQGNGLRGIWGSSSSDVFAVGSEGTILHYDGINWSVMASGTNNQLNDVWGTSPSDVFAVGDKGTILHYNGSEWITMTGVTISWISGIWGSSSSDVFVAGDGILHYDGSSWSNMTPCDLGPTYYDVWGSSGSDVFAVGSGGSILHYDGSTWSNMPSGIEHDVNNMLMGIWGSSSTRIFAVGEHILHYDGDAWSEPRGTYNWSLRGV
jgi:hypothetical protein